MSGSGSVHSDSDLAILSKPHIHEFRIRCVKNHTIACNLELYGTKSAVSFRSNDKNRLKFGIRIRVLRIRIHNIEGEIWL